MIFVFLFLKSSYIYHLVSGMEVDLYELVSCRWLGSFHWRAKRATV